MNHSFLHACVTIVKKVWSEASISKSELTLKTYNLAKNISIFGLKCELHSLVIIELLSFERNTTSMTTLCLVKGGQQTFNLCI